MAQELQINEQDIAFVLNQKTNEATGLLVQVATLKRAVSEREARIAELEHRIASLNGKESVDADSRDGQKEENIPIHSERHESR